ncbi:LexA family protein [Paenibacillus sp. MMO-58]|uniref:LexA family protein n=1 Tax=Paenibacillus sp. MMO-58 TaxID=3081290 RepID=UPI0030182E0D
MERLRKIRRDKGLSGQEIADHLGVSVQHYYSVEKGQKRLTEMMAEKLAEFYGMTLQELNEDEDVSSGQAGIKLPILIGFDPEGKELFEGYDTAPTEWAESGEHIYFRMNDDSMELARINKNDMLLVRRQPTASMGDIVLAEIDGKPSVRRLYTNGEQYILVSLDPASVPVTYPPGDPRIIGRVVKSVIRF